LKLSSFWPYLINFSREFLILYRRLFYWVWSCEQEVWSSAAICLNFGTESSTWKWPRAVESR
jgi:hypothetical protein